MLEKGSRLAPGALFFMRSSRNLWGNPRKVSADRLFDELADRQATLVSSGTEVIVELIAHPEGANLEWARGHGCFHARSITCPSG